MPGFINCLFHHVLYTISGLRLEMDFVEEYFIHLDIAELNPESFNSSELYGLYLFCEEPTFVVPLSSIKGNSSFE